ncbi:MAG: LamG-like jellyroll fold domain-containing protein [Bacteroidota bacterium]
MTAKQLSLLCLGILSLGTSQLWGQTLQFSSANFISRNSAEVDVADLDADGFNDILICAAQQRWYKGPDFTDWYEIGTSDGGPYAARVADMNGDGWPDFVTSDGARNEGDYPGHIYLYLHPGSAAAATSPWQRIVVYEGDVRHQNDLRLVDIDGDGRLDILEKTWSATERVVMAFQNANINNWTVRSFVTGETGKPEGISAGDLDGDGAIEIVQSGVYWDCPGNWRTDAYNQYDIDTEFYATVYDKTKSETGDIDNDGDLDVYIGSAEGSDLKLAWYENEGLNPDGSVIWTEHIIKDDFGKCHMVRLFDIDQDGDLDLCTGRSFGQNGLLIFYNNNNGESWTEQDYDPSGEIYTGAVADLDADGDFDVVGPSRFYGDNTRYYLNETPGDPPAAPANLTATLQAGLAIQLNWQDLSDNEGSFQLERLVGGSWLPLLNRPANSTDFIDVSTLPATTYQYRIRAANAAGSSDWVLSNIVATWPQAGQVTMTPNGGNFLDPPLITLSASAPFDEIRYTLDGSLPDGNSLLYTGPFTLDTSQTVRVIALGANLLAGPDTSAVFNVAIDGNFPPMAEAGPDSTYLLLDTICLDGSLSFDLDDPTDSLSFNWEQTAGPAGVLLHPDSIQACFIPAELGDYQFKLSVADELLVSTDSVLIRITDLDSNLVAYWPLESRTDTLVDEQIENYESIRNGGTDWRPGEGQSGDALFFDGSSGRVVVEPFDLEGDSMTISMWIRAADLDNVEARFISKASGTSGEDHYWMLSQNGGSQLRFRLKTDEGGTATLISGSGELVPDVWYFIVARYDGQEMQLYKDGTLIASMAKTGRISTSAGVPVALGNQPTGTGERPFSGWIDDVRIYGAALSQADIDQLYNPGQGLPVEWLDFRASQLAAGVQLDWATAQEWQNLGFSVERATGSGDRFESIDWVAGVGNSQTISTYRTVDQSPQEGFNFYRLRQEDVEGGFSYSPVVSVVWQPEREVLLFPNPTRDELQLLGLPDGSPWMIIDGSGRLLKRGIWNGQSIELADLSPGTYWLVLEEDGLRSDLNFVKLD